MKNLLVIGISIWSLSVSAMSFEELWRKLYDSSLKQKSAKEERVAMALSLDRAQRHWLPRAYLTGQWFSTNDPGQVFFNKLGQRSAMQADFASGNLNHPDRSVFKTGSVGVDLPLYEGGMKVAQTSMYQALVRSAELELEARRSEDYTELARNYGQLLALAQSGQRLGGLESELNTIITNYHVGAQSNPVGNSGLLGLRGVQNRIVGVLIKHDLLTSKARSWILEKTQEDLGGIVQEKSFTAFVVQGLPEDSTQLSSSLLRAQMQKLEAMDQASEMEEARYLPRIGLFAQNNLYSGSRSTATSQVLGLYLAWDLFNPDSYGRKSEALAQTQAQRSKLLSHQQEERIMRKDLTDSKNALEKGLEVLDNSDRLLQEQTVQAMKLFRSGLLSALQLSEVLNRRVDLIESHLEIKLQYLDVRSRIYQLNH